MHTLVDSNGSLVNTENCPSGVIVNLAESALLKQSAAKTEKVTYAHSLASVLETENHSVTSRRTASSF